MADDTFAPQPTPTNYQRTTGGGHLRWQPPTPEHLQEMLPAYEILSILGQGGMGAVYKGRQKSLDRIVAIKILPPEAGEDDMQFVERFKNEARTMAKMNHPAIVHVYDFGETTEGQLYIVMEYIDGTDVAKMIQSQGKLPEDYALSITAHVCDALGYAHTHGVVHRDIKPANVLINMDGQVKVADFGLAKATDGAQMGLTKTNMAMGTPDFVSPEALMPGVPLDGRADLYAVGVMLYNMLTGTIPRGAFRMPSITLQTDARFDQIIHKAMEMDRELRYQTALDLRRDLDVILTTPAAKTGMQTIPAQQVAAQPSLPQKPMGKTPQQRSAEAPIRKEPAVKSAPAPVQKSNTGMIYGIIAAVVVIALAAFMLTGGGKKPAVAAVTATTEEPPKPAPKPIPPPSPSNTKASATPGEVLTFGGHRYQVLLEPLTWPAAKAKAESMGGHLATITSKEEADFVTKTIGPGLVGLSDIPSRHGIILGTSWSAASNTWQCDTGETFDLEALAAKRLTPKRADARLIWSYRGERWDFVGNGIPLFSLVEWDDDGSKPAPAMPAAPQPAQVATPAAPAAASVMPAVAPAPAPPADPRLAQLEAGFKARHEADAQKPFLAALAALNQSYVANGIARVRATAQTKGSLLEVTALDAEKAAIEKGSGVPAEDSADIPESLKALRSTYRTALAKITAERDARGAPLLDLYLKALDVYIAELTKAGKIDEAKKVQSLRDEKAAQTTAMADTSPPSAPTITTAPASGVPVTPAASGGSGSRQLAEWVLTHGGNLKVVEGGRSSYITRLEQLPAGKPDIVELTFRSDEATAAEIALLAAAPNLDSLRIDGTKLLPLDFLHNLKKLQTLNLPMSAAGQEGWPHLGSLKQLWRLDLRGKVSDEQLAQLSNLESLEHLSLEYAPTGSGFAGMKASKKLRILNLGDNGSAITDEGLGVIAATFPSLENCYLAAWDNPTAVTNEGLKVLLPLKSLKTLSVTGNGVDDGAFETLSKLRDLKSLSIKGTRISADGTGKLRKALPGCNVVN